MGGKTRVEFVRVHVHVLADAFGTAMHLVRANVKHHTAQHNFASECNTCVYPLVHVA